MYEEPDSRLRTPTIVGCDELVENSNGAGEPNELTEGQPDVVSVIESGAQNDQRAFVTRQEVVTLTSMLERIPREFFSVEGGQTSSRLSLNVVADPPISPVRHAPSTSQEDVPETAQEGSGTQSEGEDQAPLVGKDGAPGFC